MAIAATSASSLIAPLLDDAEDGGAPFDIAAWLNSAIDQATVSASDATSTSTASASSLARIEQLLHTLSAQLDVAHKTATVQTQATITQVNHTIPALGYHLRATASSAAKVATALGALTQATANPDSSVRTKEDGSAGGDEQDKGADPTSEALSRLSTLSTLRTRMVSARDVLQEAQSWSTLEADVRSSLASRADDLPSLSGSSSAASASSAPDITSAAERLALAQESLGVFAQTSDYADRFALLSTLLDLLESHVAPRLVEAIASRDIELCNRYAKALQSVGREQTWKDLWRTNRRARLLDEWKATQLVDCSAAGSSQQHAVFTLAEYLPHFYSSFLTILGEERLYVQRLFPDAPIEALQSFAASTLQALDPTLQGRLTLVESESSRKLQDPASRNTAQPPLVALVQAYKATEEFALGIERTVQRLQDSLPAAIAAAALAYSPQLETSATSPTLDRRMSVPPTPITKEPSASSAPPVPAHSEVADWETALFAPFMSFQSSYARLESQALHTEWAREVALSTGGKRGSAEGLAESTRLLVGAAAAAGSLAEDALDRTLAFTHGLGVRALLDVLGELWKTVFDYAVTPLRTTSGEFDIRSLLAHISATPDADPELALEVDHTALQEGVRALLACRDVQKRLVRLEGRIATRCEGVCHAIIALLQREGPPDEAGLRKWMGDHKGVPRGAPLVLLLRSDLASGTIARTALLSTLRQVSAAARFDARADEGAGASWREQGHTAASRTHLLHASHSALSTFVRAVQHSILAALLRPLLVALEPYASLPAWRAASAASAVANEYDLHMPTFSLSPTECMARVAEMLMGVPRTLDALKSGGGGAAAAEHGTEGEEALRMGIRELPGLPNVGPHARERPAGESERAGETTSSAASRRRSLAAAPLLSPGVPTSPVLERRTSAAAVSDDVSTLDTLAEASTPMTDAALPVLPLYLRSLLHLVLSHMLQSVLPSLGTLSAAGAAQLAADLAYLETVLRALDYEADASGFEELRSWRRAAEMEDALGKAVCRARAKERRTMGAAGAAEKAVAPEIWAEVGSVLAKAADKKALGVVGQEGEADRAGSAATALQEMANLSRTRQFEAVARLRSWN